MNEEELHRNKELMGNYLGEYFSHYYEYVYRVIYKWQEYNELFGKGERRLDVLNESTSSFFVLVQEIMLKSIVIDICKLIEQVKSRDSPKKRLSIQLIIRTIEDNEFKTVIQKIFSRIKKNEKELRNIRDNYLAHNDVESIINKANMRIEYRTIDDTIDLLFQVTREFYAKYLQSDLQKEIFGPLKGAEALVYLLNEGLQSQKRKHERVMSGNYLAEDLLPRENL
jgi:hypothetical protein